MLKATIPLLPAPLQVELRRYKLRFRDPKRFFRYQEMRHATSTTGYSLQSFDRYKCIYVHIPKCAGISVSKSLFNSKAGGHLRTSDYELIFDRREFEHYFKFTFVRNPWDRLYSAYSFMKKGGRHAGDQRWSDTHLSAYSNFESFVEGWVNMKNVRLSTHFRPQSDYILSATGKNPMNFVGTFETLAQDFNFVKEKLGIETELLTLNATSQEKHLNRPDFRDHYSPRMKTIVSNVYERDIQLFGYSFEKA